MNKSPFNAMVATMEFQPCDQQDVHTSQSTYTNAGLVRLRGGVDSTDLTSFSLPNGILRSDLPTDSDTNMVDSMSGRQNGDYVCLESNATLDWTQVDLTDLTGDVSVIGNPYKSNLNYWNALLHPIIEDDGETQDINYPFVNEVRAARFLGASRLLRPGDLQHWDGSTYPHDRVENVHNMHVATAELTANFASVTEIGLAIEPLVQGPRDTGGKPSRTLARFVIPATAEIGSVMAFETANPVRVDVSRFVGQDLNNLRFRLVDQNNNEISDLQGDSWAAMVVINYET